MLLSDIYLLRNYQFNERDTMNKQPTQNKQQVAKKITTDVIEEKLKKDIYDLSRKTTLNKLADLLEEYTKDENKENKQLEDKLWKQLKKTYSFSNFENHYFLVDTVDDKFGPFIADFTNQIIAEYECKTATEKSLAQLIAGAFTNVMHYSQKLKSLTSEEYLSHEKNGYYSLISKEIDRSHRQYTSALMTLKQLKSPTISVKVNAQAAFVATNQQFNLEKVESYENNKPK